MIGISQTFLFLGYCVGIELIENIQNVPHSNNNIVIIAGVDPEPPIRGVLS